jgi:hypothetical protein
MRIVRHLLEAAVVVIFAFLIWKNHSLRRQQALAAAAFQRARAFAAHDVISEVATVELSGQSGQIDLRDGRHVILVVDPRCDSCRGVLETLGPPRPDLVVISVAPPDLTRTMAAQFRLAAVTHALRQPAAPQWQIYPQIFVVDRGQVVRTCLTVAECR